MFTRLDGLKTDEWDLHCQNGSHAIHLQVDKIEIEIAIETEITEAACLNFPKLKSMQESRMRNGK